MKIMVGSGADGSAYVHGTQALDFEMLVKYGGLTPARAIQGGTMINAIHELEDRGLRAMLISAVETATKRAAHLRKKD